jgi:hypothetical protein
MCVDATTSMIAFSVSVVCSYLLWNGSKNDKFFSVGVFLIGLIQLNEFFLWRNQTCGLANHLFSLSILVILWLQSVVMLMTFYFFYPVRIIPSSVVNTYLVLCTTFTAYLLYILYPTQLCSIPKGCRLAWAPHTYLLQYHPYVALIHLFLYCIPFFIFFVETAFHMNDALRYKVRYACVPVTFALALGFGIHKGLLSSPFSYADIFGSLWCFLSVGLGIIGVLHI